MGSFERCIFVVRENAIRDDFKSEALKCVGEFSLASIAFRLQYSELNLINRNHRDPEIFRVGRIKPRHDCAIWFDRHQRGHDVRVVYDHSLSKYGTCGVPPRTSSIGVSKPTPEPEKRAIT